MDRRWSKESVQDNKSYRVVPDSQFRVVSPTFSRITLLPRTKYYLDEFRRVIIDYSEAKLRSKLPDRY